MFSDVGDSVPSPSGCAALQCWRELRAARSSALQVKSSTLTSESAASLQATCSSDPYNWAFRDPLAFVSCLEQLREFAESTVRMVTVSL